MESERPKQTQRLLSPSRYAVSILDVGWVRSSEGKLRTFPSTKESRATTEKERRLQCSVKVGILGR